MSEPRSFGTRRPDATRPPTSFGHERQRFPLGLGIVAALAIGVLAVVIWRHLPPARDIVALLPSAQSAGPTFAGKRVGRAETAPLLKLCVTNEALDLAPGSDLDPAIVLSILNGADDNMRVNRLLGGNGGQLKAQFGSRVRRSGARQAMMWGLVAECVYQQNGSRLCDIDNRALAVDSASTFLRQAAQAEQDARQSDAISNEDVRELARMRDHMLDGLRTYVRDGELIAADFGLLVPAAVRVVLDANKPDHDGCAKH